MNRIWLSLAALISCAPAAPRPSVTSPEPHDAPAAAGFECGHVVVFEDLQPAYGLGAPVACGNRLGETFTLHIAADGHLSYVDEMAQYPNVRAHAEIMGWIFRPTLVNGFPVPVCTLLRRPAPESSFGPQICPAT